MVRAAKNYQMKACHCCRGAGIGAFENGNRWICDNCDGNGKVSIYPPAPNHFAGYSTRNESYSTAR